jgi:hypothetical protein
MIDIDEWLATAKKLREWAAEIEREGAQGRYPTSAEDGGLLSKAAQALEDARNEVARLQEEASRPQSK